MPPSNSTFPDWVQQSARTQEELCAAERVMEIALVLWRQAQPEDVRRQPDFYRDSREAPERKRQRQLNPAYQPTFRDADLIHAAEILPSLREVCFESCDRPLRSLAPLAFTPAVERLEIPVSELDDLSPLSALPSLQVLHIYDQLLDDARPLAGCRGLRELHLALSRPWPLIAGLDSLPLLEVLSWHGNYFVLDQAPAFPRLRSAVFHSRASLPLRDLRQLPEMPEVELLELREVWRLDGVERYPRLRNLSLGGHIEDARPLAALAHLTHLTIAGDTLRDVAPLATLPELRSLHFRCTRPRDYSPLAETPRLHEVQVTGCETNRLELAALHAALTPWDEEFTLPEPRPLRPLKFLAYDHFRRRRDPSPFDPPPLPADTPFAGDPQWHASFYRWFQHTVDAHIMRLFGWKEPQREYLRPRLSACAEVYLNSFAQAERFPEVIATLRPLLARMRYPRAVGLTVWVEKRNAREFFGTKPSPERLQERAAVDRWEAEKREQLEREHRYELLKAEGIPIDPAEFAAPPKASEAQEEIEALPAAQPDDEESDAPLEFDPDDDPLLPALSFYGILTDETFIVETHGRRAAEHYFQREAEEL